MDSVSPWSSLDLSPGPLPVTARVVHLGARRVDLVSGRVGGDAEGRLTGLELRLFARLHLAGGEVVDRDVLLGEVWGHRGRGSWRAVDAAVSRLRRKVEATPSDPRWVLTVRSDGYRLVPPSGADDGVPADWVARLAEAGWTTAPLSEYARVGAVVALEPLREAILAAVRAGATALAPAEQGAVCLAAEVLLDPGGAPDERRQLLGRAVAAGASGGSQGDLLAARAARARFELGWGDWQDARAELDALLDDLGAAVDACGATFDRGARAEEDASSAPPGEVESGDAAAQRAELALAAWILFLRYHAQLPAPPAERLAAAERGLACARAARSVELEAWHRIGRARARWDAVGTGSPAPTAKEPPLAAQVDAELVEARLLLIAVGDRSGAAFAELARAAVDHERGDTAAADAARGRARALDAASVDHRYRGGIEAADGLSALRRHDLPAARAHFEAALAVDLERHQHSNVPGLRVLLAQLALAEGDLDGAEAAAAGALAAPGVAAAREQVRALVATVLAPVALERGDPLGALAMCSSAADDGSRVGLLLGAISSRAAAEAGRPDPGLPVRESAVLAALGAGSDRLVGAAACWLVGARLARGGAQDWEAAARVLDRSRAAIAAVVPDYGGVLLGALDAALGRPSTSGVVRPPPDAPPASARHELLRHADRWARGVGRAG